MEGVHKTAARPWISSHINIKKFRDDGWETAQNTSDTKTAFNLSDVEFEKLEQECGLDVMKCPFQDRIEVGSQNVFIPEGCELGTLKFQSEELKRRKGNYLYQQWLRNCAKFPKYPSRVDANYCSSKLQDKVIPVSEPEVVLYVQVFRPFKQANANEVMISKPMDFTIDQDLFILGCQGLTELRDKIECVSDLSIPGDYSENPQAEPEMTCQDVCKSGFFFINDVFYIDMRHPECIDYSDVIIDWAKTKASDIGPLQKALMENTRFIDLNIQLGYPYLYTHQGYCEHLIIFTDLQMYSRLHHSNNLLDYPAVVTVKNKKRTLCMICQFLTAEWIVYDCKRVPENPSYFCKQCFIGFNYDENDQKIGEFRAYHFIDRSKLL